MIEVSDLAFRYPRAKEPIFEGHSFSLGKGEILAILGPNGSGKTTLIKTILSLLPVDKGTIRIEGKLSYVPQNTLSPFEYSVLEMVVMGASGQNGLFATPTKKDRQRALDALEQVGMLSWADESFAHLSGGQKQMVLDCPGVGV